MKLQIISDLHIDIAGTIDVKPAADYLVIAGDFGNGTKYVKKILARWCRQWEKIFFVLGNHDYYLNGDILNQELDLRLWLQKYPNCVWLDNDVYEDEDHGKMIFGGTMWTRFWGSPVNAEVARAGMNDYRNISIDDRTFRPHDSEELHASFRKGLENCQKLFGVPDLVISHHGPSIKSISEGFETDRLNPAYVEPMGDVLVDKTIWVHGHTHSRADFIAPDLHDSRVVCWARGYGRGSIPTKVIDI